MKAILKVILLLVCLSGIAQADEGYSLSFAVGNILEPDEGSPQTFSVTFTDGPIKYSISHWEKYSKTPWWDEHEEWRHARWAMSQVPEHTMISVTYEVYDYNFTPSFKFFVDLGLTATSSINRINSSEISFRERFGFEYKDIVRAYLSHSSNAGIRGANHGENSGAVDITVWRW